MKRFRWIKWMSIILLVVILMPQSQMEITVAQTSEEAILDVLSSTPKFLTLPFTDDSIRVQQGWLCHWVGCEATYGSLTHGGIDYVKGTHSSNWQLFDVVAAAPGSATCSYSTVHDYFVTIEHAGAGSGYRTRYIHLGACDRIPIGQYQNVERGEVIGRIRDRPRVSGDGPHLHFDLCRPALGACVWPSDAGFLDPYDIRRVRDYYPYNVVNSDMPPMGSNHYWTTDPPSIPSQDTVPPTKASNVRPDGWTGPYTGDTTPSFRWDPATDADSGIAGYYVAVDDWTPEGGGGNDWWAGNVTAFTLPSALPEGQHIFAVTSKDNAGNVNPTNTNNPGDAPYYTFYVDATPPSVPSITISGPGCVGIQNNVWQNTCYDPAFTWSATDSGTGVKDYRYYWGTSSDGSPIIITTETSFDPGPISSIEDYASYYLNITARDNMDHESGRASFGVRYDSAPPTVTLAINGGAETANQVSVWLVLAENDIGSGVSQMRFSTNGLAWTSWEPYNSDKAWTLPALNRQAHTVYVQVRDRAGNESGVANDSITLDLYPVMPHSVSYRICNDVINVGGRTGITSTNFSLISSIGQPWATGADTSTSAAYAERNGFLSAINGCRPITHSSTMNYTVTQWVIASGGNLRGSTNFRLGDTTGQPAASGTNAFTSTSFTLSSGFWAQITGTVPLTTPIKPTPPPPTPTPSPTPGPTPTPQPGSFGVSINGGMPYTNDPYVTVNTWAPDVTQVRLSNNSTYEDSGWMTYQLTHTWILSTEGLYVLPRTVYAWFKDMQGEVYGPYQDNIVYDPVGPQGSVRIVDNIPTGLSPTAPVTLSLEASDDNSGVAQMRLGEDTLENTAWQPFANTITWPLQSDIVFAQFRDRAGNASSLYDSNGGEHALDSRPLAVSLSGPTLGLTNTTYTFAADVLPITATLPITYVWQATGYTPVTNVATLSARDIFSFTWNVTDTQYLTVTAMNNLGAATGTYSITIVERTSACELPLTDVDIDGPLGSPTTLYVGTSYTFAAIVTPDDATPPITYTWLPQPDEGQNTPYSLYQWSEPDTYTITLVAENCSGIPVQAQRTVIVHSTQHVVYLPLVLRNQ